MDFSRIGRLEVFGIACAVVAVFTLFFLPWFSLETDPSEVVRGGSEEDWVCGVGDDSCTGWETFPILRWILLIGAAAPLILAWILVRGHTLSWAPGELTTVGAFAGLTLIVYNGIIDKPGSGSAESGVSLDIGYWVALLVGIGMAYASFMRAMEAGGRQQRKAPGTV
jgi:hypothetical protein